MMNELLQEQFLQKPEVSTQITLYLFEHRSPRAEAQAVSKNMEAQKKLVEYLENIVK